MNEFVQRHASKVIGTLSGFDRMLFRGTLRRLAHAGGLSGWLWVRRVLLKDFGTWSHELTERVREAAEGVVRAAGRPMRYLDDPSASKEELARAIAARDGITRGLVCQFSAVESSRAGATTCTATAPRRSCNWRRGGASACTCTTTSPTSGSGSGTCGCRPGCR